LLKRAGRDFCFSDLDRVEQDFQFLRRCSVLVHRAPDRRAPFESCAELLFQLAGQRGFRRLAGFHFSSGKFPFERRRVVASALTYQEAPVGALNDRRNDGLHRDPRMGLEG
jgi:hypothetical protein